MSYVLHALNSALHDAMADESVVVVGEDILDPYGGAFKVTKGLSTQFPERVFTTPISEAGFVGMAVGMAMRGVRPVVEIMFGDFLLLTADQLLNHAVKYPWMYDNQVTVPLTIRAPMGGRRGYGPTHSQSVEKHFIGMPGLEVVAITPFHDVAGLLQRCIQSDRTTLFIENKLMYGRPLRVVEDGARLDSFHARVCGGDYPTVTLSLDPFREADLTIVAYGGMAELALEAAKELLMEHELVAEVVLPAALNPLDLDPITSSLRRSGRLLVCEESGATLGFGAEVIRRVAIEAFDVLRAAPRHVAAVEAPIANTRTLESMLLPQTSDILRAAEALCA